ncbi:MAG: hypothetical protein ACOCOI_07995 [Prevotella sp.]
MSCDMSAVNNPVFSSPLGGGGDCRGGGGDAATAAIVERFFHALDLLKERRTIRGKKTFCDRYGINRWNMNTCLAHPDSGMFKLSWLTYLVRDFEVSADWLLLGRGDPLPPLEGEALKKAELYRRRKAARSPSRHGLRGANITAKNRPKTANGLQEKSYLHKNG